MSGSDVATPPVGLAVRLSDSRSRMPFLLEHVAELRGTVAAHVAFTDLGPATLELLLDRPALAALNGWLQEARQSGLLHSAGAVRDLAGRTDGHVPDDERQGFRSAQYELSARALGLLAGSDGRIGPGVAAAELWAVFGRTGPPLDCARAHAAWLRAVAGTGPWPGPDAAALQVTWRLAHCHWLRLTGGATGSVQAELDAVDALVSAAGRGMPAPPG